MTNMPRNDFDKIISRLNENDPTLEELDLSCKRIKDADVKELVAALRNNTMLRELDLGFNEIADDGLRDLAEMLKTNHTIRRLNLQDNRFYMAVDNFANALEINSSLIYLTISKNNITESLKAALQNNFNILSLLYNGGDETVQKIEKRNEHSARQCIEKIKSSVENPESNTLSKEDLEQIKAHISAIKDMLQWESSAPESLGGLDVKQKIVEFVDNMILEKYGPHELKQPSTENTVLDYNPINEVYERAYKGRPLHNNEPVRTTENVRY